MFPNKQQDALSEMMLVGETYDMPLDGPVRVERTYAGFVTAASSFIIAMPTNSKTPVRSGYVGANAVRAAPRCRYCGSFTDDTKKSCRSCGANDYE